LQVAPELSLGKWIVSAGENMRRMMFIVVCLMLVSLQVPGQTPKQQNSTTAIGKATEKFDPSRNARKDIEDAVTRARKTHKRIILDVGGEWCIWCHRLDDYFAGNAKLNQLKEANFVWLKINFSPENENKELLSTYPTIPGYPHLFVLDENGKLLHSQDTSELEAGKSYDLEKMFAFLRKWAPPKAH
jgi:thiol:disulfide interchange protein